MNKKVIEIPSNNIIPAGRSLGIEPNLLSGLSGFPERAGTCAVEKRMGRGASYTSFTGKSIHADEGRQGKCSFTDQSFHC